MNIRDALNLLTESTGKECAYIEVARGQWYSFLENDFGFKGGDWMDDALCYGPFASEDEAHEHLRQNHANPGGSWSRPFDGAEPDDQIKRLVAQAPENMKNTRTASRESPYRNFNNWGR